MQWYIDYAKGMQGIIVEELVNLRQGSLTVKNYFLKFNHFSKYDPHTMADPRENMSKFVTIVCGLEVKECRTIMLIRDIYFS